jgi:hypothetical protein
VSKRRHIHRFEQVAARCCVRAEAPSGRIIQVGTTCEERLAYAWCDRYHEKTGCKTWIVNLDTDETIYTRQAEPVAAAVGGAA